ncbi:MAG: hypothetical protein FJ038_06105 [Chloroflexi bacterium]|nr:hypothetical protein [Chloroflexota bacterium]
MTRYAIDTRFLAWAAAATIGSLLALGLTSAIIPNPVFGRQIPPEPFAIAVWLVSAPLMGLVVATYLARPQASVTLPAPLVQVPEEEDRRSLLGYVGGFGAFLAIGCPVCNKAILVLLGTSGALNIWAPLQPVLGAASLAVLVATLIWRLRIRARDGACAVPAS